MGAVKPTVARYVMQSVIGLHALLLPLLYFGIAWNIERNQADSFVNHARAFTRTLIEELEAGSIGTDDASLRLFLDGLALSGVLPAPLIIFATFVGYVAGGPIGAVAMTVGVFLPAFAFSLIFYDRLEAVVENKRLHAFLDGVAAGVVGLIGATTLDLAQVTAERVPSLTVGMSIFAAGLAFLYAWKNKLNVVVVILAAGLAGWLVFPNQG